VKFLKILKEYLVTILTIIFVISIFVLIVLAVIYLKGANKKLQIIPVFKVIDCKQDDSIDALSESVAIARDILLKVKK
jgi:urea transporter